MRSLRLGENGGERIVQRYAGPPTLPRGTSRWRETWSVSWLRASRLAFPVSQWLEPSYDCPLQWRGRAGFTPASVLPFARALTLVPSPEKGEQDVNLQIIPLSRQGERSG